MNDKPATKQTQQPMQGIVEIPWPVGGVRHMVLIPGDEDAPIFRTVEEARACLNAYLKGKAR